MMNRSLLIKLTVVAVLALSGIWLQAFSNRVAAEKHTIARGIWGGEHILLEVSGKGGEVEFDCPGGRITRPLKLNKHGSFSGRGPCTLENGGPGRRDSPT